MKYINTFSIVFCMLTSALHGGAYTPLVPSYMLASYYNDPDYCMRDVIMWERPTRVAGIPRTVYEFLLINESADKISFIQLEEKENLESNGVLTKHFFKENIFVEKTVKRGVLHFLDSVIWQLSRSFPEEFRLAGTGEDIIVSSLVSPGSTYTRRDINAHIPILDELTDALRNNKSSEVISEICEKYNKMWGLVDPEPEQESKNNSKSSKDIAPYIASKVWKFLPGLIYDADDVVQRPVPLAGAATPNYPAGMKHGVEGSVIVQFVVKTSGDVTDVEVIEATNELFDEAAKAAVKTWRYKPGSIAGKAVQVRMKQTITFSPDNPGQPGESGIAISQKKPPSAIMKYLPIAAIMAFVLIVLVICRKRSRRNRSGTC